MKKINKNREPSYDSSPTIQHDSEFKKQIYVISTSLVPSFSITYHQLWVRAQKNARLMGFDITFDKRLFKAGFTSASDLVATTDALNECFRKHKKSIIMPAIGGFNSNRLIGRLDYKSIAESSCCFVGHSDNTTLCNDLFLRCGIKTFYGPNFLSIGDKDFGGYTQKSFVQSVLEKRFFRIQPSDFWCDNSIYDSTPKEADNNTGFKCIKPGNGKGIVLGGNLNTFNLLPLDIYRINNDVILFLEDDFEVDLKRFMRDLCCLAYSSLKEKIKGFVFGRFQPKSTVSLIQFSQRYNNDPFLKNIPAVVNLDFGHTCPMLTIPIGTTCVLDLKTKGATISFCQ